MARLVKTADLNGIEIYFDSMPSEEVSNDMKSLGFRWHRAKKYWYAKENADRLNLANKLYATPESYKTTKKYTLLQNPHRVLLTRGRNGVIIYIPGMQMYDNVYELLINLGIKVLQDIPL